MTDKSCLLELMLDECSKGKPVATEGLLWLNRYDFRLSSVIVKLQTNQMSIPNVLLAS